MDRSAKPTEDCMFTDPMKNGVLKLQNAAHWGADRTGGGIAVYNLTGQEQRYSFRPADVSGLEPADKYWVYDYFAERVLLLDGQERYEHVLEKDGFCWFILLPKGTHGACLGLLDKYVGFTAAESIVETEDTTTAVISESGTIGFLSGQKPQKVLVNGTDVTERVTKQDFLYKIALPEEAVKVAVSIQW
jgi:hypothetical protein